MNLSDWLMTRHENIPGPSQRRRRQTVPVREELTGIGNEVIITLVFAHMNWDISALCCLASVSRRLCALAGRVLWRELCFRRAPRMTRALATHDGFQYRVLGGWQALAKLMFYCGGWQPSTDHFQMGCPTPGHFVDSSRISRASGLSLLSRLCLADDLFLSEICVHPNPEASAAGEWRNFNIGLYRGVYRSFVSSRTREALIQRNMGFLEGVRCPFCKERVWSMTDSGLVPWKRAAVWLSTRGGRLEYFVCVNGHLHGMCWLVNWERLEEMSDDEGITDEENFMDSGDDYDMEG